MLCAEGKFSEVKTGVSFKNVSYHFTIIIDQLIDRRSSALLVIQASTPSPLLIQQEKYRFEKRKMIARNQLMLGSGSLNQVN